MRCTCCGAPILEQTRFCGECGRLVLISNNIHSINTNASDKIFEFSQTVKFGNHIIRENILSLKLGSNILNYTTKNIFFKFIKSPWIEEDIKYQNIAKVTLKTNTKNALTIHTTSGAILLPVNGIKYQSKLREFLIHLRTKAPQVQIIEIYR